MPAQQKTSPPAVPPSPDWIQAYSEAYARAHEALPLPPAPPTAPPAGQGFRLGTNEEIAQKLTEAKVTSREEAEELAEQTAYKDAGLPPPKASASTPNAKAPASA